MSSGKVDLSKLAKENAGRLGFKINFQNEKEFLDKISKLETFTIFYFYNKDKDWKKAEGFKALVDELFDGNLPSESIVLKLLQHWWVLEVAKGCKLNVGSAIDAPAAVTYDNDGTPILYLNPSMVNDLDFGSLITILEHETYHLLAYHPVRGEETYKNGQINGIPIKDLIDRSAFDRIANYVADSLVHENISEERLKSLVDDLSRKLGGQISIVAPASKSYPGIPEKDRIFEKLIAYQIAKVLSQSGGQPQSGSGGQSGQRQQSGSPFIDPSQISPSSGKQQTGQGGESGEGEESEQERTGQQRGGSSGKSEKQQGKGGEKEEKGKRGKGSREEKGKSEREQGKEQGQGKGKETGSEEEGEGSGTEKGKEEKTRKSGGKISESDLPSEIRDQDRHFVTSDNTSKSAAESSTRRVLSEALKRARQFLDSVRKTAGLQSGDWEDLIDFLSDPESFVVDVRTKEAPGSIYNPKAKQRKITQIPAGVFLPTLPGHSKNILTPVTKGRGRILIVIDTSGSVDDEVLRKFYNVVDRTTSGRHKTEVYVLNIDADIQKINGQYFNLYKPGLVRAEGKIRVAGRGGTDFKALEKSELTNELENNPRIKPLAGKQYFQHVILLTDGVVSSFPQQPPEWGPKKWIGIYTIEKPENSPSWIVWHNYDETVKKGRLPANV